MDKMRERIKGYIIDILIEKFIANVFEESIRLIKTFF